MTPTATCIVIVEDAGNTASRLETADTVTGIDGWLVEAPWPEIVDEARARNGLPDVFEADPAVLARSPLVMAMWNDRLEAIVGSCEDGALTWKCVGNVAGKQWSTIGGEDSWGAVKPGFADPRTDGIGALVLAQAAVSFFGTTDLSSDQFNEDDFQRWIRQMATAVPQNPTFADMLTFGPSAVDVTGTTEAEAGPGLESSRDKGNITITYPAPVATADVVLAQVAGASGGERLTRIVGGETGLDALAAAAWRVPGRPPAAGVITDVELPADSGLPSPGAIDALRQPVEGRGREARDRVRPRARVARSRFPRARRRRDRATTATTSRARTRATASSSTWRSSPEKIDLMTEPGQGRSTAPTRRRSATSCVFVRPQKQGVGRAAQRCSPPAGTSPTRTARSRSSGRRRRARGAQSSTSGWPTQGQHAIAEPATPFMLTPLVIAMPKPMAEALGYPDKPIGLADILAPRQRPAGLGGVRPSRVGPVPARQDQPELLDQRAELH